ncbi:MAG TPA: DUF4845 domain-containing protein [Gammaproteobacteria bacterium]|nr:DUF4845 domain-containing protein [Gammaproteobacteria bacterium]
MIAIFGFLVITFFKIFPFYYDNFKLQSSLESLVADTELDPKSKRAIWQSLQKRLFINEVRNITRENVTMSRKDNVTTITVSYEVRNNYIGNLFIGAHFSEQAVINR